MVELFGIEIINDFVAEVVVADGTDNAAVEAELLNVISEIRRRAAYFLSFGEHVP